MSEEALVVKMLASISTDDAGSVKKCLSDRRLDKAKSYDDHGNTLLHLAVDHHALGALAELLAAGCDPNLQNASGNLPLHEIVYFDLYEVLKDHGVSLSSENTSGYTIWHLWAQSTYQDGFRSDVFDLDPEEAGEALQKKTSHGDTPLSLLLRKPPVFDRYDDMGERLEHKVLALITACSKVPRFWQKHGPLVCAAEIFGSEKAISQLQAAGARFEPATEGQCTQLHRLEPRFSVRCVQILVDVYPNALEYRFEGKLPVEAYITANLQQGQAPSPEIMEILLSPILLSSQQTLWSFVCSLLRQAGQGEWANLNVRFLDPNVWVNLTKDLTANASTWSDAEL
ncbi:hypothetical protein QQX98_006721 [Neonectria punicea]|uniref:Ankyrin repeat protein n=1 Tax=Neonectria punicea TaxID=979145 RepID=A0ABR1H0C2_9HYPO